MREAVYWEIERGGDLQHNLSPTALSTPPGAFTVIRTVSQVVTGHVKAAWSDPQVTIR